MSAGREFQVVVAATEKARRVRSVRALGTQFSSGASDDRRGRLETAVWIRLLRYAGVKDDDTLNVSDAILYVSRCLACRIGLNDV